MEIKELWPGWEVVGDHIGKGGNGIVYEIRREVFGDVERNALKIIRIPKEDDEVDFLRASGMDSQSISDSFYAQVSDIINEYKLMRKFRKNPNIVHCEDFRYTRHADNLGWDIYIMMELLTPLMKGLDKVSSEQQIIRLGLDICNALVSCQTEKIIHRDIKPENIFIDSDGIFKLGDFGIARVMERTTHASMTGTPSFMAPEVFKGDAYGPAVDIYSLGMVLYWLLNERRAPFLPLPPAGFTYSMSEEARSRRFSGEPLPSPKNGSPQLQQIVLKACAYAPGDRQQSALELKQQLLALSDPEQTLPKEKLDLYAQVSIDSSVKHPCSVPVTVRGRTVQVAIPEGIQSGQVLVLPKEGLPGRTSNRIGDLYVTVTVMEGPSGENTLVKSTKKETKTKPAPPVRKLLLLALALTVLLTAGMVFLLWPSAPEAGTAAAASDAAQTEAISTRPSALIRPPAALPETFPETAVPETVLETAVAETAASDPPAPPTSTGQAAAQRKNRMRPDDVLSTSSSYPDAPVFGSRIMRKEIRSVTFVDSLEEANVTAWDVSQNGNGSVMAWLQKKGDLYDLYIGANGSIAAPENCAVLFAGYENMQQLHFNGAFATDSIWSAFGMFHGCTSLTELDLRHFDTSGITNMHGMFYGCSSLRSLDVGHFDTSNVTNLSLMFYGCSSLTHLDVSRFNTSAATKLYGMFGSCSSLTALDVSRFDTSGIDDMSFLFNDCSSLTSLDVSGFDTSKVTNMALMFHGCRNLTALDVTGFDTALVTDMSAMFDGCGALKALNVRNFNTANVTDMSSMFSGCSSLSKLDVSGFRTGAVTNTRFMFAYCIGLGFLNLSRFDTAKVTDMSYMFAHCQNLSYLDVSGFDTANVTAMKSMFQDCTNLMGLDIRHFTISPSTATDNIFYQCPHSATFLTGSSTIQ